MANKKFPVLENTITVTNYKTSDGFTFMTKEQAERHEEERYYSKLFNSMKRKTLSVEPFSIVNSCWYLVSTKEDIDYWNWVYVNKGLHEINFKYVGRANRTVTTGVKLGDWVAFSLDYDSNGETETTGIVTLSGLYEKIKKMMEDIDAVTVEGKY